jgi:hypothetical protein
VKTSANLKFKKPYFKPFKAKANRAKIEKGD